MGVTGQHSDTLEGEGALEGLAFKHAATIPVSGALSRPKVEHGLGRAAFNGSTHKAKVPDSIMLAKKRALSELRKAAAQKLQHGAPAGSEIETAAEMLSSHEESARAIKDDVAPQRQEVPFGPEAITAAKASTGCRVRAGTEIGGQRELAGTATAAELGACDAQDQADSGEHAAICMILQV